MDNPRYRILVLGAQIAASPHLTKPLKANGYELEIVTSQAQLQRFVVEGIGAAIALLDLKDSEVSGYEAMRILKEDFPDTQIMILSQKHSIKEALDAQSRGAFCYFAEPVDVEDFLFLTAKAAVVFELALRNRDLQSAIYSTAGVDFIGRSTEAQRILDQVQRVANVETTVLLTGETGTGKTTLARLIHNRSIRREQPFVSLSCAAIPRELLEAELFGYERGAFTGANSRKMGSIELADKGTLFLDEIGDLPLELQPKLLTFLQDRVLRRLGGIKENQLDVRILAATNKNLEEMVRHRDFREDLFFRINVVNIQLPSLRDRRDDLESMADNILRRLWEKRGGKPCRLAKDALKQIKEYAWPGNVRELENVLERAALFCSGSVITSADLGLHGKHDLRPVSQTYAQDEELTLAELEHKIIASRLEKFKGNKQLAAQSLGISLKTIYNKTRSVVD